MEKPMQNVGTRFIMDVTMAIMDEEKSIGSTKTGELLVVDKYAIVAQRTSTWPRSRWRSLGLYTQVLLSHASNNHHN